MSGISKQIIFLTFLSEIFFNKFIFPDWKKSRKLPEVVVFACIHGGGLFRSKNNGEQWTGIDGNNFYYYLVDDSKILAGTFTGVFESTDYGLTWYQKALQNKITTSISKNDNYSYAANYTYGIFRSSDRGITWSDYNEDIPIDKFHPYTVFAIDSLIFCSLTSRKIYFKKMVD